MCGELMIYNEITQLSGGRLYVPLDLDHFDYILDCLTLPNENNFSTTNMIQLGFPSVIEEVGVCSCHNEMNQEGYECPVCKTYICNLPVGCPICETQLVSAINISKSFHHLFPLSEFILDSNGKCFTCGNRSYSKCPKCDLFYCEECDNFVHENLQFCYGC